MNNYKVKQGETITDICLNTISNISNWYEIINDNDFDTLTPNLEYKTIQLRNEINNIGACNSIDVNNFWSSINTLKEYFVTEKSTLTNYVLTPKANETTYTVKEGETLLDICVNQTGTIFNYDSINFCNNFDTLTPSLKANDIIKIPQNVEIQRNVYKSIRETLLCNSIDSPVFWATITKIINNFVPPVFTFEDGYLFAYEDENIKKFENDYGEKTLIYTYLYDGMYLEDGIFLMD